MLISLESQVLKRHLSLFTEKNVLFAGKVTDNFPYQIECQSIQIWSCYFDYAKDKNTVYFDSVFEDCSYDLIVYFWTKSKQEASFQLMQLLANAPIDQEVLIIGENRCGVRSVEKLLQPYGNIIKIDSARRCGLYRFLLKKQPHFDINLFWRSYQNPKLSNLKIYSLPGVFSADELDIGTNLLLSTLNTSICGRVLDLGCGAGVIGSYIKKSNPQADITMSDIHAMAVASAQRTLAENQLQGQVIASDVFSHIEGKFDLIISNPPFHDGIETAYHVITNLIQQAKRHLTNKGELRIVANTFLPYPDLLEQYFGRYQVLAKTNKFTVYSVRI